MREENIDIEDIKDMEEELQRGEEEELFFIDEEEDFFSDIKEPLNTQKEEKDIFLEAVIKEGQSETTLELENKKLKLENTELKKTITFLKNEKNNSSTIEEEVNLDFEETNNFFETEEDETEEKIIPSSKIKSKEKKKKEKNGLVQKLSGFLFALLLMVAGGYYIMKTGGSSNKNTQALSIEEPIKKENSIVPKVKQSLPKDAVMKDAFKKEKPHVDKNKIIHKVPPKLTDEEIILEENDYSPIENKLMNKKAKEQQNIRYLCRLKVEINSGKYAYYIRENESFVLNPNKDWVMVLEKNIIINYSSLSSFVEFDKNKFLKRKMFSSCKPIIPLKTK